MERVKASVVLIVASLAWTACDTSRTEQRATAEKDGADEAPKKKDTTAPSASAPVASAAASASAAPPAPAAPLPLESRFDGEPSASLAYEAEPFVFAKQRLTMRRVTGWEPKTFSGYPGAVSAGGVIMLVFDTSGASRNPSHVRFITGSYDSVEEWGKLVKGKWGPEHREVEMLQGRGKLADKPARWYSLGVVLPREDYSLTVVAAVAEDAAAREAELVAMIQSIARP